MGYPENTLLSVLFVSRKKIIKLNSEFFNKNRETNVMAFPLRSLTPDGNYTIGDIIICPDVARDEARVYGMRFLKRLIELLIHGILHLHGYKDRTQREWNTMKKKQEQFLDEVSEAGLLN